MNNFDLLTVQEVADLLKINSLTVYEYIRKNQLPAIKLGRYYRIEKQDLEEFIYLHKTRNYEK